MQIGIIGAGGMAAYHAKGFSLAGADVVGIADPNEQRSEAFAALHGIA
ncbi:Gfo/Idh/MocA family oxidoreductase, partial [Sphaerochaeta sp. S2]